MSAINNRALPTFNLDETRPPISQLTFECVQEAFQKQNCSLSTISVPKSFVNTICKMYNKKNNRFYFLKLTPLEGREKLNSKIDVNRGESLISSIPPHPGIHAISQRFFFGKEFGLTEERKNDSECVLDVSDFIEGKDFIEIVNQKSTPYLSILQYAIDIGNALVHLHEHGIICRDLAPQNVMINKEGRVKLVDFEFARQINNEPLSPVGSYMYRAPEVENGKADPKFWDRIDSFSFGVLLFNFFAKCQIYTDKARNNFVYQKIPIQSLTSKYIKDPELLDIIRGLLEWEAADRMSIKDAVERLQKHLKIKCSS